MSEESEESLADYNIRVHVPKKLGGWRKLYLDLLAETDIASVVEVGAGSPDLLRALETCTRRMAIDGGDRWKDEFLEMGVEFLEADLNDESLPDIGRFDVAVCSDVFEHLLFPEKALAFIARSLNEDGFFISHVPNEFTLKKTVKVMLGRSEAIYSQPHCEEFNHPHLHRFTRIGFRKFIEREFRHHLFVTDLRHGKAGRFLRALGLSVPYALELGPTFLSTNCPDRYEELKAAKAKLLKR